MRCGATRSSLRWQSYLGDEIDVGGDEAGMHLVAWFPRLGPGEIDALVAACRTRDIGVYSIARHSLRPMTRGGLILGYGLLDVPAIEEGVRGLAAAYRACITGERRPSTRTRAARRSPARSRTRHGTR